MPELPDITAYIEALGARVLRQPIQAVRLASPFVLRTFDPPISEAVGKQVVRIHRIGKRIALELEGDLFLVVHLMIAGRLKWLDRGAKVPGKVGLAAIDFPYGTLILTEAATKKRASLHFVRGAEAVRAMNRGGIEVLDAPLAGFRETLYGGSAAEGRKIFLERPEASCVRCHKVNGEGASVTLSDRDYAYYHKLYFLTRTNLPRRVVKMMGNSRLVRRFPSLIDPMLPKQLPFFFLLYRMAYSPALLSHRFAGVPLSARWATGGFAGPHDLVFWVVVGVVVLEDRSVGLNGIDAEAGAPEREQRGFV